MNPKTLQIGLKKDIRLERYNVSQCAAQLTYDFEQGDTVDDVANEMYEQLVEIVTAMIDEEVKTFQEKTK